MVLIKKVFLPLEKCMRLRNSKHLLRIKISVVIIGGGVQGLETAWSIHQAGKKVSIVEVAPRLMARQLDERTSLLLKNRLEEAGDTHLSEYLS